jgi:hypothetical protein
LTNRPARDKSPEAVETKNFRRKKLEEEEDPPSEKDEDEEEEEEGAEEWERYRSLNNDVNPRRVLAHPDDIEFQDVSREASTELIILFLILILFFNLIFFPGLSNEPGIFLLYFIYFFLRYR